MGIEIKIDVSQGVDEAIIKLNATVKELEKAVYRAAKFARSFVSKELKKTVYKVPEAKRAAFNKARIRLTKEKNSWLGYSSVRLHDLGTPRKTTKGARVKSRVVEGAFIITGKSSGKKLAMIREGSEMKPARVELPEQEIQKVVAEIEDKAAKKFADRVIYEIGRMRDRGTT